MDDEFDIRLDHLLYPDPVAAGMNYLVIASLALMYRSSNEHAEPITISRDEGSGYWRIVDGRHRSVASMVAGRKTVKARVQ